MSQITCPPNMPAAFYPPIQFSVLDKQNLEKIRALKNEAPFGRLASGAPRSELLYRVFVSNQKKRLTATDLQWPFWVGLGLGATGVAVLAFRSRSP
jgi:hypothetical protein